MHADTNESITKKTYGQRLEAIVFHEEMRAHTCRNERRHTETHARKDARVDIRKINVGTKIRDFRKTRKTGKTIAVRTN